jgi:RNA polymerase sigma-70 factor (ECF subfamily)
MQHDLDLGRIIQQHGERVRRVLRRRGVQERDLPDAEQEVFLVVHRKLAAFEGRASLSTWLHRIATNIASEHRRRAHRRYETAEHAAEPAGSDLQSQLEAREALARAQAALAALSVEQREAFVLHELAGLSMHEVAAELHVPLKTAFSRFYAARRNLLAALGRRSVAATLLAWLSARTALRAHAQAAYATLALELVSLALVAAVVLPQHAPIAEPPARPTSATHTAAATVPLPPASPITPAPSSSPPPSLPPAPSLPRSRALSPSAPTLALSSPAAVPPDELVVTVIGAQELRPIGRHPLEAHILPTRISPRIHVRSRRGAPIAFDDAVLAEALPRR